MVRARNLHRLDIRLSAEGQYDNVRWEQRSVVQVNADDRTITLDVRDSDGSVDVYAEVRAHLNQPIKLSFTAAIQPIRLEIFLALAKR